MLISRPLLLQCILEGLEVFTNTVPHCKHGNAARLFDAVFKVSMSILLISDLKSNLGCGLNYTINGLENGQHSMMAHSKVTTSLIFLPVAHIFLWASK